MTDTITARQTDKKLEGIRQTVAAKNGKIPFLLLPVRIEARFMKVDKPVGGAGGGVYEKLLERMSVFSLEMEKDLPRMPLAGVPGYFKVVTKELKEIRIEIGNLSGISRQQKEWLAYSAKTIKDNLDKKINQPQPPRIEPVRKELQNELSSLLKDVEGKKPRTDNSFKEATKYLAELNALNQKFKNIRDGKLPYTNPKNKKQLYNYIEKLQDQLEQFYRSYDDKVNGIRRIKNNQFDRIVKVHQELKDTLHSFPENLKQIHNDRAWMSFTAKISGRQLELQKGGMNHFDKVILTKLKFVSDIKHVSVTELFYQSLRTWMELERFNTAKKPKKPAEITKFKNQLQSRMDNLKVMTEKVVECDEGQLEQIDKFWDRLNVSLKVFEEKTEVSRPGRSSSLPGRNFSLNVTERINVPARLKLLLKPKTGNRTILNSLAYAESQSFFYKADEKIGIMIGLTSDSTIDENELKNSLRQLAKDFSVAGRKNLPVSQKQYDKTKGLLNSLTQKLQQTGMVNDPEMRRTIDIIRKGLDSGSILTDNSNANISDRPIIVTRPAKQQNELWVRIFPDDIHVNVHEKDLTAEEVKEGKLYWMAWWAASDNKDMELGAWKALVLSHGSSRAAWIAKKLDPKKLRSNQLLLNNKPGKAILEAVRFTTDAAKVLENVKDDAASESIFDVFDSNQLIQQIYLVNRRLTDIEFEQAAFLQQELSELHRLENKLLILQNKINNASSGVLAGHSNEWNDVQSAFTLYGKLQEHFQAIESLDTNHYLDRLNKKLNFPNVNQKSGDWTVAPHSRVLPNHFVVLTLNGNEYSHIAVGNPVPDNLHLGLDPSKFEFDNDSDNPYQLDSDGNLQVDAGMKWMVDFGEAVKKGMGLKIPITQEESEKGFDRVLVIGISDKKQLEDKRLLEELIENHHYAPQGMSLLSVGTSTNNTSDEVSGYSSLDDNPEESYRIEMGEELFSVNENHQLQKSDGKRLADALGIDPGVLQHLANSEGKQISHASAMHRSLWHATFGDYMESGWDYVFTYDNIERVYQYFKEDVIARGILPSIRVGSQPYGILPVTAFSKIKFHQSWNDQNLPPLTKDQVGNPSPTVLNHLQLRFDIRLKKLLLLLKEHWTEIQKTHVKHAYNLPAEGDEGDFDTLPGPQQHFMEMLGLQATSTEHYFRYGINIAYRGPDPEDLGFSVNYTEGSSYGPVKLQQMFSDVLKEGYFYKSYLFNDEQSPSTISNVQATNVANRISTQFSKSRIFKSRFLDKHTTISGFIIDSRELSKINTIEKNINGASYIQWLLREADSLYDILERNNFEILPSNSMLFLLLRQSLLLAYREAALHIMKEEGFFSEDFQRLIGASDRFRLFNSAINKFVYTSKWTFLFRDPKTFNGLEGINFSVKEDGTPNLLFQHLGNGERSLADFLLNKSNLFNSYFRHQALQKYRDRVDEIRDAMAILDTIPTFELNQLLAEHMDLSSYRLDAWILGLANRRLRDHRKDGQNKGIFLGAYGWLEDLRPGGKREEAEHLPDELMPKDKSPVYTDADNEGYIHAPSLNQALTAAVLRSGYTASRESIGDLENQMAVNLSSRRVRQALQLVEGVNNGQSLGAVLGYQFEKGLHERYNIAELDRFIYGFRRKFPLVVPIEVTTDETEDNPQINVVDGSALLEAIENYIDTELRDQNTDASIYEVLYPLPFDRWPGFLTDIVDEGLEPGDNRAVILRAIAREIDRIGDSMDSLGDLVISESVYQVVQGNHVRAAAVVEALAGGKSIPELQFINTPRTGVVVTHRAILHFDRIETASAAAPAGWPSTLTPRSKAEPSLNSWLGSVLGPASHIHCLAIHEASGTGSPVDLTFDGLGLQPIDLLFMLGFNPEQGSSELDNRVVWKVQQDYAISAEDNLRISFKERIPGWTKSDKTIYEITPLILQLRDLLADVRYIDAIDLKIPDDEPEADNPERLVTDDLETRVNEAETTFRDLVNEAQSLIDTDYKNVNIETATFTEQQRSKLRDLLFGLSYYSDSGSIPAPTLETSDSVGRELLKKLITSVRTAQKSLVAVDALKAKFAGTKSEKQKAEILLSTGKKIFGRNMVMLPHYRPENKTSISQQLNLASDSGLLRHRMDPHVLSDWMQRLADIRPALYAWDMGSMLSEAFGTQFSDWQPVQFPYAEGDYWLGIEYPESYSPSGDYLSLILIDSGKLTGPGDVKAGIIIDEWTEIIPNKEEVTGIAFHYDQPDAMPPQNLLLAVNPDVSNKWAWDNLVHILNETFDLAKIRAVEPDHIEKSEFAQVLPAVISEVAPPNMREYDDEIDDTEDKPFSNPLGTQVVMDFADNLPKNED